jgi:hypothetical protein
LLVGNSEVVNFGAGTGEKSASKNFKNYWKSAPSKRCIADSGGNYYFCETDSAACWETHSSRRRETNIQTLPNALAKVEKLRGVSYDLRQARDRRDRRGSRSGNS